MNTSRETVQLAIIKDKKLLLWFKKDHWWRFMPLWGERITWESDRECLERVLTQKIRGSVALLLNNAQYISHLTGRKRKITSPVESDIYATTIWNLRFEPIEDILKLGEFFYDDVMESNQIPRSAQKIAKALKELNLIL
jgi:hypothetical protein